MHVLMFVLTHYLILFACYIRFYLLKMDPNCASEITMNLDFDISDLFGSSDEELERSDSYDTDNNSIIDLPTDFASATDQPGPSRL